MAQGEFTAEEAAHIYQSASLTPRGPTLIY